MTTPVSKPTVLCTVRLTSSGSGASPAIWRTCSSKPIARLTCGSPNSHAKPNARSPASAPASMPLTSSDRTMALGLMAGEAEQVAPVVDEFVDVHAGEDRRRALLGADEIERHQTNQPGKDRPRQDFPQRDGNGGLDTCVMGDGHANYPGSCVPASGPGLQRVWISADHSGATAPTHTGFRRNRLQHRLAASACQRDKGKRRGLVLAGF